MALLDLPAEPPQAGDHSEASGEVQEGDADLMSTAPAAQPTPSAWLLETRVSQWDYRQDPLGMWGRSRSPLSIWGGGHGHHEGGHEEEAPGHHLHPMHILSPCMTIMLGMCASLFAVRLIRELYEQRATANELGEAADGAAAPEGLVPGVRGIVALDSPGLLPFRPFGGTGHRLSDPPAAPARAPASEEAAQAPATAEASPCEGAAGLGLAPPPLPGGSSSPAAPQQWPSSEDLPVTPG